MRRLSVALLFLTTAAAAPAQELAIFDVNDFVDPRQLGAVPASFGRFGCPCSTVLVTRVIAGWDHDAMNVTQPMGSDVGFGHIASSLYRGPWQINLKAAALRDVHTLGAPESRAFPRNFFTVQLAYYLHGPGSSSLRTELSWRGTHYHERTLAPQFASRSESFAHELGAEVDTEVSVLGRPIGGSLIYTTLAQSPASRVARNSSRLAYIQRFPRLNVGALRLDPSVSAGLLGQGLKFRSAGRLDVRPKIAASVPLRAGGSSLNVVFAPDYERLQPPPTVSFPICSPCGPIVETHDYAWRGHHEVALFVDVPILIRSR